MQNAPHNFPRQQRRVGRQTSLRRRPVALDILLRRLYLFLSSAARLVQRVASSLQRRLPPRFLRAINRRLPPGIATRIAPFRGRIVRVLQRRRGGTKFIVSSTVAEQIEKAFLDSNELVSDTYFDSRFHPLFSRPLLAGPPDALPKNDIGPLAALGIAGFLTAGLAWNFVKARFVKTRNTNF